MGVALADKKDWLFFQNLFYKKFNIAKTLVAFSSSVLVTLKDIY
jgi:hypothetical protein